MILRKRLNRLTLDFVRHLGAACCSNWWIS